MLLGIDPNDKADNTTIAESTFEGKETPPLESAPAATNLREAKATFPDWDILPPFGIINPRLKKK